MNEVTTTTVCPDANQITRIYNFQHYHDLVNNSDKIKIIRCPVPINNAKIQFKSDPKGIYKYPIINDSVIGWCVLEFEGKQFYYDLSGNHLDWEFRGGRQKAGVYWIQFKRYGDEPFSNEVTVNHVAQYFFSPKTLKWIWVVPGVSADIFHLKDEDILKLKPVEFPAEFQHQYTVLLEDEKEYPVIV